MMKQTKPDIVGLQEANALLAADAEKTFGVGSFGSVVKPDHSKVQSVILYNRSTMHKVGNSAFAFAEDANGKPDNGRPMLGAILIERSPTPAWCIFFLTVHMPHGKYDLKHNIQIILNKLYAEHSKLGIQAAPRILITGDFNHSLRDNMSFRSISNVTLFAANYGKHKTAWFSPRSPQYDAAVDDILYDKNAFEVVSLKTTPINKQSSTSDHSFLSCDMRRLK
jgi:exonuclease III